MSKSAKQANSDHEGRVADAVVTAQATVKTAAAAYNGLASGYVAFAASVVTAEATRDTAIAASIVTKAADQAALQMDKWANLPKQIVVR